MTADDVRAVIEAGERFDPATGLAFRLAAITGARRSNFVHSSVTTSTAIG